MSRARGWTCRRQAAGVVCGTFNPPRSRKCSACEKPRPPKRRAGHMVALDLSYEVYLERNGGREECAICGARPHGRRLDRDHDHKTGRPRGLLCHRCNRQLPAWMDPTWLLAAATYLKERS